MQNLKVKALSVAMAAITAASPILSSYTVYASDITVNDDGTVTQISTSTEGQSDTEETKFLFVNLKTTGGKVVLNEGEEQEETIRLNKEKDEKTYIQVYDKDDVLLSTENAIDNGYTYVYEAKADDAVNVKAVADDGYEVTLYELTDDSSGTEMAEDTGFESKVSEFKYPVFMEYDKTVKIGFEKKEETDIDEDLSVKDVADNADAENGESSEDAADAEASEDADLTIGEDSEDEADGEDTVSEDGETQDGNTEDGETEGELIIDNNIEDNISSNLENKAETVDTVKTDADNVSDINIEESTVNQNKNNIAENDVMNDNNEDDDVNVDEDYNNTDYKDEEVDNNKEENDEHFTKISNDISSLDKTQFYSSRIVIMTHSNDSESSDIDSNVIIDKEHIVSSYNNIILLQYKSVEQAMTAYLYYKDVADRGDIYAVEPDSEIKVSDTENVFTGEASIINPFSQVEELKINAEKTTKTNIIALIDTGVSKNDNVVDRVSLIGDVLVSNGHGDKMLQAILDENENAKILSIKAMDDNGKGTVSSVIAGIEYAISKNVKIINLSLSAKTNMSNIILQEEIEKAVAAGINVVAAAGNNGADVKDYMPGSVDEAIVIGACNDAGLRLTTSNYGDTVDYNVVANTTSEAAAKFSGWLVNGWNYADINNRLIYDTDYTPVEIKTDGKSYHINFDTGSEYSVKLDHNDGIYKSGEKVTFKVDAPSDTYLGITALKPQSNTNNKTDDLMYCEVSAESGVHIYSFIMPTEDVLLKTFKLMIKNDDEDSTNNDTDISDSDDENDDIMTIASNSTGVDKTQWYYRSDGVVHPFYDTAMGSGGYDSYKWISYTNEDGDRFEVTGYCMQHQNHTPPSGTSYPFGNAVELKTKGGDDVYLRKAIFYGYGGPGWKKTINGYNIYNIMTKYGCPTSIMRAMQHYIVDYLYDDSEGFGGGLSDQAKNMIYEIKSALSKMPDPVRDRKITPNLNATVTTSNDGLSRTNTLKWNADSEFLLYVYCGNGMQLVNETTKQVVKSGKATIKGGESFHLEATGVTGKQQYRVTSNFPLDYHAMVLKFGGDIQDIGFGYRTNGKYYINVTWPDKAKLTINKRFWCSSIAQASSRYGNLKATFTVYSDAETKKPVGTVEIDGGNERYASGSILLKGGIYYVKETTHISGTVINEAVYGPIKISNGTSKNLSDYVKPEDRALKSMDDNGWVINKPIFYTGLLLKKKSATENKYLKDAVFKVDYSERGSENFKVLRTWYFVTDKNGEIKYKQSYLADNNETFKGKYKSSPLFSYSATDSSKTALPLCVLHIQEVVAPKGYARDNTVYTVGVTVSKNKNGEYDYTVQNAILSKELVVNNKQVSDYWSVRVQAKKIDENGKGLAGAKFDIFDNEDCTGDPITRSLISKDDGTTNIEKIDRIPQSIETYEVWCKEITPPKGHIRIDKPIKLTFKLSDFKKLSEAKQKDGELKIFGIDSEKNGKGIVNPPSGWQVKVNARKIDEDNIPLSGAKFTVYYDEDCTESAAELISGEDGYTDTVTIDLSNDKNEITLWCKETDAPKGYIRSNEAKSITFTRDEVSDGETLTFGPFVNKPAGWQVRVHAKKVNKTLGPLAGAVFAVYNSEKCDEESFVGNLTSQSDGMTNILTVPIDNDVDNITLYCKEVDPPENCLPINDTFHVSFTKKEWQELKDKGDEDGPIALFGPEEGIENITVTPTPTISVTPTPPTPPGDAGLHIKKVSNASEDIMDLSSYTLEGAEFEVVSSRDGYMGTLTTDKGGFSNTLSLPDNGIPRHEDAVVDEKDGHIITPAKDWVDPVTTTYYITEKTPPHWHKKNYSTKSITVVMPRDNKTTFEVTFDDEPKFCKNEFELEKLGVKGEYIKGAVFKVEYYDADDGDDQKSGDNLVDDVSGTLSRTWYLKSDENGRIRLNENYLDPDNQSDAFFKHNNQVVIPIGGYLKITEINAPAEYEVEDEPVCIQCNENTDFKLTYNNARAWYDEYKRCRINLKKYDTDGKTPIPGVEFEIKFVKQAITPTSKMHPNFKRLLKEGETLKRNTDENGEVYFDNLDQGTYEITETKTLPGMALLKDKITVTLPMTMTAEEAGEYQNVDFESAQEDVGYTNKWYFYECTFEITNNHLFTTVATGGSGKWVYGFTGFGTITILVIGYINRKPKRRKKYKK